MSPVLVNLCDVLSTVMGKSYATLIDDFFVAPPEGGQSLDMCYSITCVSPISKVQFWFPDVLHFNQDNSFTIVDILPKNWSIVGLHYNQLPIYKVDLPLTTILQ